MSETKTRALTTDEKAGKNEFSALCRAARNAAVAAGFETKIPVNAPGYWKTLRSWCEQTGKVAYPAKRKGAAPTAAQIAAAKRAKHAAAEKARRARVKAAKAKAAQK